MTDKRKTVSLRMAFSMITGAGEFDGHYIRAAWGLDHLDWAVVS
jgi:hypothetical protein